MDDRKEVVHERTTYANDRGSSAAELFRPDDPILPLPGALYDPTSQLPVSRWHEQIGDPTLADGILDRLVHNAHRIEMRGDSMRKNRGKPNAK